MDPVGSLVRGLEITQFGDQSVAHVGIEIDGIPVPSDSFAANEVEEIVEVLRSLKGEGLAILLVEQNLRAAFALGDRHHIMNKGEICFTGTSAEIESNEDVLRNYLSV